MGTFGESKMNNPNVDKQKHNSSPDRNNIYGETNGRNKRETKKANTQQGG